MVFRGLVTSIFCFLLSWSCLSNELQDQFREQLENKLDLVKLTSNSFLSFDQCDSLIASLKESPNANYKGRFYNVIGILYTEKGISSLASEYFLKALEYESLSSDLIILIYINLGNSYAKIDEFEKGEKYYQLARKKGIESNQYSLAAVASNNVGLLFLGKRNFDNAKFYFREALELRKQLKDSLLIANSLHYMGVLNFRLEQFDSAAFYYTLAYNQLKKLDLTTKNENLLINTTNDLAYTYVALGLCERALALANENMNRISGTEFNSFAGNSLFQVANIFDRCGKTNSAIGLSERIAEECKLEGYGSIQLKALNLLKTISFREGDLRKAYDYSSTAYNLQSELLSTKSANVLANARYQTKLASSRNARKLLHRQQELSAQELEAQKRINQLLLVFSVLIALALFGLFYSNREKNKANRQLLATNLLIEKQNQSIKLLKSELESKIKELERS